MSFFSFRSVSVALLLCAFACTSPSNAQVAFQLHYKVIRDSLIVVPVSVNNSTPVNFLLDTGSNRTIIDEGLVKELGLPQVGETTLTGILGSAGVPVVQSKTISMGGATVTGMNVSVRRDLPFGMRGVLGEDFLRNFDLLIDNRRQLVDFEPLGDLGSGGTEGLLISRTAGKRIPVQLRGSFQREPTCDRLIVQGAAVESGGQKLALQLDSGSNTVMIFDRSDGVHGSWGSQSYLAESFFGRSGVMATHASVISSLRVGTQIIGKVTVAASSQRAEMDVDGILPTSLFRSIFICHSGRFVILNPGLKPGWGRSGRVGNKR